MLAGLVDGLGTYSGRGQNGVSGSGRISRVYASNGRKLCVRTAVSADLSLMITKASALVPRSAQTRRIRTFEHLATVQTCW